MNYCANVRFLREDEGGKSRPPSGGYKPQMKLSNGIQTSCIIKPQDESIEIMELGVCYAVSIKFQFEDEYIEVYN